MSQFHAENRVAILLSTFNGERFLPAQLESLLAQTFEELRKEGDIPQGFQRLIDAHFRQAPAGKNEVILNRDHRLVQRALRNGSRSPLASVLRLLVLNSLTAAGAGRSKEASQIQMEDLDWIADALWGQN